VSVKTSAQRRLNLAWLAVVAVTVIYLWIDHTAEVDGHPTASTAVTVSAIVLALVKYRIVLREFMDVRSAPLLLRRITDLLVAVIGVSLLATYLTGQAVAG
jgi:hypothetical protein